MGDEDLIHVKHPLAFTNKSSVLLYAVFIQNQCPKQRVLSIEYNYAALISEWEKKVALFPIGNRPNFSLADRQQPCPRITKPTTIGRRANSASRLFPRAIKNDCATVPSTVSVASSRVSNNHTVSTKLKEKFRCKKDLKWCQKLT